MKVFVVSLTRSIERRERVQRLLDQEGVDFEFFDAVDGSLPNFTHSEKSRERITRARKGYQMHENELACFASHYEVWQHCIKLNEAIIVLEDNVDPVGPIKEVLTSAFAQINYYGYIKLSATRKQTFHKIISLVNGYDLGGYSSGTCGTTAYIISPSTAELFVKNAQTFLEPVDDYMEKPWRHGVQVYSVYPDLFSRAKVMSTIGSKRKDKSQMTLFNKIYAEFFRTYESILRFISWKNKS